MVAEAQSESPVPESTYVDYEQDLLDDDVPPAQARASRRALERIVDRVTINLATKPDLREVRNELRDEIRALKDDFAGLRYEHGGQLSQLLQDVAALKAEMKMFKWMFAVGTSSVLALLGAVLVVLLTRL
ncbi:MAG: hypothetical protein OXH19_03775 [Chloroflexi bacterium]|nr:hypothetical protein [Chloroflexota bacterium]MCY3589878.1 hypothetical protein [Chloroflexota bacterium]MCY3685294.1 hypothetical protein [Chloroflexota bacterium]MDE2707249.1 hypothetical protein [Chloroflexota bacterium]